MQALVCQKDKNTVRESLRAKSTVKGWIHFHFVSEVYKEWSRKRGRDENAVKKGNSVTMIWRQSWFSRVVADYVERVCRRKEKKTGVTQQVGLQFSHVQFSVAVTNTQPSERVTDFFWTFVSAAFILFSVTPCLSSCLQPPPKASYFFFFLCERRRSVFARYTPCGCC